MDEELKKLQETWQQGVPADVDAALRHAATKAERSRRLGRWLMFMLLPLFVLLLLPGLFGWGGLVESLLVLALGAVGLALGVITLLRWPRRRADRTASSSVKEAISALLAAREHRLWLWAGWFARVGWLTAIVLMLALALGGIVVPRWDVDPGRMRLLLAGIVAYVIVVTGWREVEIGRLESEIERLRVLLALQGGDAPAGALGGFPRPWQRRALLAGEAIVVVVAIGLAWRGPAVDVTAARSYMGAVMMAGQWADEVRALDASFPLLEPEEPPTADDIARYCRVRGRLAPALQRMRAADDDLRTGASIAVLGDPNGADMTEWQSAGARWQGAQTDLLMAASRALKAERTGPARLRRAGEWIEWGSLARPEAAAFALRGADARRWFGLRLRVEALSTVVPTSAEDRDRLERARTVAESELTKLQAIARSRSSAAPAVSLDACPSGALEPIDNIAWLALLDTPEPIWEEAAW